MEEIILFDDKKDCCGCSACMNICPKQAISMERDEYGFIYPQIDKKLCINCGACKKVCAFQNKFQGKTSIKVFAAVNRNKEQLMNSASGGIFSAIAAKFLEAGGVVFGAALDFEEGHAIPHHIAIESLDEISKLQGSKYVQSSINESYMKALDFLKQGRQVLFSGTPCQIDGLYGFLGREYENLTMIDLICHGVPSANFFDDYIQTEKKKRKAKKITGFVFRDKKNGWGCNGRISLLSRHGNIKNVYVPSRLSSYYTLFLDSYVYRESCYSCKYAGPQRYSDLTIGDYWGVKNEHPELLGKQGYDDKKGISCILANSKKGVILCDELVGLISMHPSALENVQKKNGQLSSPSKKPEERDVVLKLYRQEQYSAVEKYFRKKYRKQIIVHTFYNAIPRKIRLRLKNALKG